MKKLSLILAIIICLSSINIYAAEEAVTESAAVTEEVLTAVDFINAIGIDIPQSGDFSRKITRIEFLRAVMSAIKADAGDGGIFTDLSGKDFEIASAAVKLGIISDAPLFNPDREITAAEAYKMAVVATGFSLEADLKGGYPNGYIYAASYTDISANISLGANDTVSYADFVVIIRNMCETNIKYQTAFGDENGYAVTEGKNILSTYHGLKAAEGIFQADRFGSLYDRSITAGDGKIIIDSQIYNYSGDSELGCYVKAYYSQSGSAKEIVYLEPKGNTFFTVDAEDIADTQNGRLIYYDGDKTKDVSLVQSPAIIYNGVASTNFLDFDSVAIANGSLTLIDNDENGVYDVVHVNKFDYMFISKINAKKDGIYDANKTANAININDDTYLKVTLNGLDADISAVAPNMAAMVYKSEHNEKIIINLSNQKVNGKIDGMNTNAMTVTSKGISYKYSDYFRDYYLSKAMSLDSSSLVFAADGKLVAIDSPENNLMMGIILDAGTTSGLGSEHLINLYTEDNEVVILSLADKVSVDNQPRETASDVMTKYINTIPLDSSADADKNNRIPERFIAYAVNGDDEIVKIDTIYTNAERAANNTPNPNDGITNLYPTGLINGTEHPDDSLRLYKTIAGKKYKMNIFDNDVALTSSTIVYNFNTTTSMDENLRFSIGDRSQFADDQNLPGGDTLYTLNVGQTLSAQYVLYTRQVETISGTTKGGLVEKVSTSLNQNGEECVKLQIFDETGEFQSIYVPHSVYNNVKLMKSATEGTLTQVSSGDYIRFSMDSQNNVSILYLDYDFSTDTFRYGIQNGHNSEIDYYKGYVYSSVPSDTFFILANGTSYNNQPTDILISAAEKKVLFTWGYIAVYDDKTQNVTRVKTSDIVTYLDDAANCDYAIMRQGWGQGKMLVVYRNIQ